MKGKLYSCIYRIIVISITKIVSEYVIEDLEFRLQTYVLSLMVHII